LELSIRREQPADFVAVHAVNAAAFPSAAEARLVDQLRQSTSPNLSLVADDAGKVVGHIFFSPVAVHAPSGNAAATGLAPLAVLPGYQGKGIGGRLVRDGLEACAQVGELVVFVLGHVGYYPRFGFRRADEHGLYYAEPGPNPAFMVAELRAGALAGRTGEVRYAPEFYAME
jgi:putative acetyltransferase